MLAQGISWAARSLSDSWGVQVMLGGRACFQQDSVCSTQTRLRTCGNTCRAEPRSTVAGAFMSFSLLGTRVSGPWSSEACSYFHPYPRILPTHISFCFLLPPPPTPNPYLGCKMGTENSQAEPGLWLPLPGLLRAGRGHPAPECSALTLVSLPRLGRTPEVQGRPLLGILGSIKTWECCI